MSKQKDRHASNKRKDFKQEDTAPVAIGEVADQIAYLIVRQHCRLLSKQGKNNNGTALY